MRCARLLLLVGLARPAAAELLLLPLEARDARPEAWLSVRLRDRVGEKLLSAGVDARGPLSFADPPSTSSTILLLSVRPEGPSDPGAKVEIGLELRAGGAKPERLKLAGRAEELELLAAQAAGWAAERTGSPLPPELVRALGEPDLPFTLQRALGQAKAELEAQNHRKALLGFERVAQLARNPALPEVLEGRRHAQGELVARGESDFGARADLAPAALERASVAAKNGNDGEELRALEAFLRNTPEHAQRWARELALEDEGRALVAKGARWVLQAQARPSARYELDPRTGSVLSKGPGVVGLADVAGRHLLALDGRSLIRLEEDGKTKWRTALPFLPAERRDPTLGARGRSAAQGGALEFTSGLVAVLGEDRVLWVETTFGAPAQLAEQARPLAGGVDGVLAQLDAKPGDGPQVTVGLLRPGKKTPAWTALVPQPDAAALTVDRVLLLSEGTLTLLRAHDGRAAAQPVPVGPAARFLGADGRYAVLASGERELVLVDVLAGERTGQARGPARAVAAYSAQEGVVVLAGEARDAASELLFFGRAMELLDRAVVPGAPLDLVRGSPMTPGPVAITRRGLYAFAEHPAEPARMRDVDALLRAAVLLDRQGDAKAALRIADHVARRSAGGITRAERLRAEWLGRSRDPEKLRAAATAQARAARAADPSERAGPFSLFGPPAKGVTDP